MHQSFPNNDQLAVMKGVLDGEPLSKIAHDKGITVSEANKRYKDGMRIANLKTLHDLVLWGLTTGVIQDPPRTDLAKAEIDKGYREYPIWIRVLQAMTTSGKDADIAQEAGLARSSLEYYKELIKKKFLLGDAPTSLIRFAFQVTKPIAPPKSFKGWRPEGLGPESNMVLVHLAQGYGIKEIADLMGLDEKTINYHILQLKNYFDVSGHGNPAYAKLINIALAKRPDLLQDRPVNLQAREQFILHLPPQQKTVFRLLAQGMNVEQIAQYMKLSKKTIEYHRAQLFGNLGITNVQDLAALAHKYKDLMEPDTTHVQQDLFEMPQITKRGRELYANEVPLKTLKPDEIEGNIAFFRMGEGSFWVPGTTYVYFMDSDESAQAMQRGEIVPLFFPRGTFSHGGSPITDIWKKRFAKQGTEHILGVLEANTNEQGIFLDMLSVRPGYRRNSIATRIVDFLKRKFPEAEISHSGMTDNGRAFLKRTGNIESRYLTPQERDRMIRQGLMEGFHDKAKLEVFHYRNSGGHAFWFFRNELPAGEVQIVENDGRMMGFGVQRSLQGTGFGRAMLKYIFETTGLPQLTFDSEAHAFYHKVGARRKKGDRLRFTLDRDKFKTSPLTFKEIDKDTTIKYLAKGHLDPWPARN